jgi:hypothetical protein
MEARRTFRHAPGAPAMNARIASLLIFLVLASAAFALPPPAVITGPSGAPLVNPKITGWDGEYFTVEHDGGIAKIPADRMPDSLRVGLPRPEKPKDDDLPLGIGLTASAREVRERILGSPGAKLIAQPAPGKMVFGHVRFANAPCDLYVLYDGDALLMLSFQFTRATYGGAPSLVDLIELLAQKYGAPDRMGGDFAAFWAHAGGKYMTVTVTDTSAGPSVDFTSRATLDRKERRQKEGRVAPGR